MVKFLEVTDTATHESCLINLNRVTVIDRTELYGGQVQGSIIYADYFSKGYIEVEESVEEIAQQMSKNDVLG